MRKVKLFALKPKRSITDTEDELALDEPVCIFVNGEYYATLIATPEMRRELAVGYLLSEGIIKSAGDIKETTLRGNDVLIDLDREVDLREAAVETMNLIVTACASRPRKATGPITVPKVDAELRLDAGRALTMVAELNRRCRVHFRTGGTHAAMLCDGEGVVGAFAEDVGRHNAVDKAIGVVVLGGGDLRKCVLLSTGRQSGEMVQKVARAGIPIVIAMAVPLSSGIRLAEVTGVTLTHIWRGSLKVYTHPERIELDSSDWKKGSIK